MGDKESAMIVRELARAIAETEVKARKLGTGVGEVLAFDELAGRSLNMYMVRGDQTRCWVAYVQREFTGRLESSTVILVDQETGEVVYAGGAGDEG